MIPLRKSAAKLLQCDFNDVCVGSSATEILSSLAWAIAPKEGTNVVSTQASFPSTVYPWTRVSQEFNSEIRLAPHDNSFYTKPEDILNLIDSKTSVVTLSHVEYANGQRYDLELFSQAAHDVGALLIIDATQSLGAMPINAYDSGADAIVSSGYKWLRGSFGAAVAYISPNIYSSLIPGLLGFRSHNEMWDMRADRFELPNSASRFEFSTINFGSALGLSASIDEILDYGIDNVWKHNLELINIIVSRCKEMNLHIASSLSDSERSAIISLEPPSGQHAAVIVNRLQDDYGILVTNRSGLIRVSPHMDNSRADIIFLMNSLEEILSS
ncbi:MAG: aminotransferase class V-fold PLP-dependent enzyme [Candidatus Poseidoniales archaeon]|nr:aminotransferase class V-fold PLP-dependent enzyme [Candidatus Poseidoniales archaeon]|tara:strand:- start:1479 stop:2459 length:981 start_codon:yes stop_codon:yes gene_type:complete